MPFGPWKDFAQCVAHMRKQTTKQYPHGYPEDVAKAICGKLQRQLGGGIAYNARLETFRQQGKLFTKIWVIDSDICGNNWGVTDQAREEAAKTLLDAPLLGNKIPNWKGETIHGGGQGDPHQGEWPVIGRFKAYQNNGETWGLAEITDPYAEKAIESRTPGWTAVSPSITPVLEWDEFGKARVGKFRFDHVLFVDKPAFSPAGVYQTCSRPEGCGFGSHSLCAALQAALQPFTVTKSDEDGTPSTLIGPQGGDGTKNIRTNKEGDQNMSEDGKPCSSCQDTNPFSRLVGEIADAVRERLTANPQPPPSNETPLQAADAWDTVEAPDRLFAFVPVGKPKSERKLPLASVQKKGIDPAIVRNALARFKQTDLPANVKGRVLNKICAAARRLGIDSDLCKGRSQGELDMAENDVSATPEEFQAFRKELDEVKAQLQAKATAPIPSAFHTSPVKESEIGQLRDENKLLKERLDKLDEERKQSKARDIVALEMDVGVLEEKDAGNRLAELMEHDEKALDLTKTALQGSISKLKDFKVSGTVPRIRFEKELADAKEANREALFGVKRQAGWLEKAITGEAK